MIRFDHVSVTYDGADRPTLSDVELTIPEGELVLVVGATGSGKSTLLRCLNGLVPTFTGGTLNGTVTVAGRSTAQHPPRELADVVGFVAQDPRQGFVTETVEDELAYTMESLAVAPDVMRRRVEETLDLLGIADLRHRPLLTLSGGQRQRVAIGAVLTAHPQVLVLDEPTSALDPQAAEEVLAAIQRLVHDLGLTVVMSEHRLERVVQYADRILVLDGAGRVTDFATPAAAMVESPLVPPVVALGRWAGWDPLPLSIRDARRAAAGLRAAAPGLPAFGSDGSDESPRAPGSVVAQLERVSFGFDGPPVLRRVDLDVRAGEVVALMGRNGAGKSSALGLLAGQLRPHAGTVRVGRRDPADLSGPDLLGSVALVPQEAGDLLWAETVAAECRAADSDADVPAGTTARLLGTLRPEVTGTSHPGDLSEGSRLSLVLAIMLAGRPDLLLLDEPTRGLDYCAKEHLAQLLRERAAAGQAVIVATHDVELVAEACTRMVVLGDGEVVLDADARTGAVASPTLAPQVAKIMAPVPALTVADVQALFPEGAA